MQAQNQMVQKVNAHRRELQLEVGDRVLVKLQPFHQTSVATILKISNVVFWTLQGPRKD